MGNVASTHGLKVARGGREPPPPGCVLHTGVGAAALLLCQGTLRAHTHSAPVLPNSRPFPHSPTPEDVFLLRVFCVPQVTEPCAVFVVTEEPGAWLMHGILSKFTTAQAFVPPATIPSASADTGRAEQGCRWLCSTAGPQWAACHTSLAHSSGTAEH